MPAKDTIFHVILIRPSHYDRDGYPIQWVRSIIPSNSLGCLYGLSEDCAERHVLGEDVEFRITPVDEVNTRVLPDEIILDIEKQGGRALLALTGIQTNQFPRAVDIARPFLDKNIPVCMGGFHPSGCISMLKEMTPELREAQDMGISFFLGEAEGERLDEVFKDAWNGKLKPIYDHLANLPGMEGVPLPFVPKANTERSIVDISSFDMGRGCPFQCSFCSIINVHGRVSRYRTGDDLEKVVRRNLAMGVDYFFVTDDNLARNRNWEEMFDRLIALRENEGIKVQLVIQVDVLCHRIPNFIDKAMRAGTVHVFIGLENINPANLLAAKKKQNRISEYREMLLEWRKYSVFITCGYIVGFPFDTKETVLRDVEIIKNELPLDAIYFTYLTPLPGSEDHKNLYEAGEYLDPDLNKYDLHQRVSHHPVMSDTEWEEAVNEAWKRYYTHDHMVTVLRRVFGTGSNKRHFTLVRMVWHFFYARGHFGHYRMEGGFVPLRYRKDRRPGLKLENPLLFYPKYAFDLLYGTVGFFAVWLWFRIQMWRIQRDPERANYRDVALTPPQKGEEETLELFTATTGGAQSVVDERKKVDILARGRERAEAKKAKQKQLAE